MLKQKLFLYTKDVIDKKRKVFFLSILLAFISIFFRFSVFLKNFFYDYKIIKAKKVGTKVISIGNIVAGGTGKTPFTIFLAKKLISKYKIAIVSRGYNSKAENKNIFFDSKSFLTAKDVSDEALLLKNHIKEALFFVGKDKFKSSQMASKKKCDITIIDDGFQYRKLKKDLEIVLINALDPFGKNSFLPKGYLRENPKNLKRADFIVINNAEDQIKNLENKLRVFTKAPMIYTKPYPKRFLDKSNNEIKIKNKTKIASFCAIANPDIFFNSLKMLNFEIVSSTYLLDHESFDLKNFNNFVEISIKKGAQIIITTEKDIVKLPTDLKCKLQISYLEIDLKITHNEHHLTDLVEKI